MNTVDKVWGREIWLINCNEYCSKILELKGGYSSSIHYHKKKKETFWCLEGAFTLDVDGKIMQMSKESEPVTILPKQKHSFRSKWATRILEVSTQHDENDIYRQKKSHKIESYCFDIDGTICTQEPDNDKPYNEAKPYPGIIERINKLHAEGHKIIFYTARGTTTGIDWREFTVRQLWDWGVNYDELVMGKPEADVFVDDRAVNIKEWLC